MQKWAKESWLVFLWKCVSHFPLIVWRKLDQWTNETNEITVVLFWKRFRKKLEGCPFLMTNRCTYVYICLYILYTYICFFRAKKSTSVNKRKWYWMMVLNCRHPSNAQHAIFLFCKKTALFRDGPCVLLRFFLFSIFISHFYIVLLLWAAQLWIRVNRPRVLIVITFQIFFSNQFTYFLLMTYFSLSIQKVSAHFGFVKMSIMNTIAL